jgi:stage IV sporulation protein FB
VLLGEPHRTQMDVNFNLFGFPVRISAFFWLVAVLLGWNACTGFVDYVEGRYTVFHFLILWVIAVLVSILVHEMGHGFAMRRYGIRSRLVLYHFGGLAIPEQTYSAWRSTRADDPKSSIVISAAGPLSGLLLAALIVGALYLAGYRIPLDIKVLQQFDTRENVKILAPFPLAFFYFILYVNIFWSVINLLPVYPLDGGQISRNLFILFGGRNAVWHSLMLSIVAGAAVAVYALYVGHPYLAIMFALLAYSSYQTYAAYRSGRGPW